MARLFVYDSREFDDPDPKLSVDEVRKQLAEFFPELANADAREERRGEDTVVTFTKRIGTKGTPDTPASAGGSPGRPRRRRRPTNRTVVAILRRVPEKRLRVFELASELLDSRGQLDVDAAAARAPEVNLAMAEAQAYARATDLAVAALRRLPAR